MKIQSRRSVTSTTTYSRTDAAVKYILALEVVLDVEKDTLLVQAAYTAEDIPSDMVESLVKDFEQISLDLCDGNLQKTQHTVSQPLPPMITSIPPEANSVSSLSAPSEETLTTIRAIVSEFLRIDPSLLSDTISLFSIGLDSIRSVGLSRALQAQGMHIPSLSIMNHPTIIDIASRLSQNLPEVRHKDQRLTSFKESCQRIRDAVGPLHLPLSAEDNVEIFPTTTLQAGMLSQVWT